MRRRQPMKTALSHPQLFGPGSTNQGRLACAPDPVSGWGEPITDAPAHLMHCDPLAGIVGRLALVRTPTQVLWIQAIILTAGQSDASSHYHMWPGKLWALAFCLVCVSACMCMCASEQLCSPIPIMLCGLISRPLSLRSWLHPLLETQQWALCCPHKELEASAIKRDEKLKKKKHVYGLIKMIRNRTIAEKWKVCKCRLSVIKSWGERRGREGERELAVQTSHCEGYE